MSEKLALIEAMIHHGAPSRDSMGDRTIELKEAEAKRPTRYATMRANQIEAQLNEQGFAVRIGGGTIEHYGNDKITVTLDVINKKKGST